MNIVPYIFILIIGVFAGYLAMQYYKLAIFNHESQLKIRFIALLLAAMVFITPMLPMYKVYQLQGDTVYGINTSGIITQGTAQFNICWDPTGLNVFTSFSWGVLIPGETKNVVAYLINRGSAPIIFSSATLNWVPPNGATYLKFSSSLGSTPLQSGNFRKIILTLFVESAIIIITNFSFDIVITGTEA